MITIDFIIVLSMFLAAIIAGLIAQERNSWTWALLSMAGSAAGYVGLIQTWGELL